MDMETDPWYSEAAEGELLNHREILKKPTEPPLEKGLKESLSFK
jgi:hypothetical protein